eukprot:TRINITY_DN935_c0_g1_i1.p1 TRINITY_DN935_c0_g1~~TRINITY_DN935_c0_g1_i1.p1  ORF type:complete len:222 (+),score=31.58 TRINITY_DN935_c0_g1_i1:427-1092(+)
MTDTVDGCQPREYKRELSEAFDLPEFNSTLVDKFPVEWEWNDFVAIAKRVGVTGAETLKLLHGDILFLLDETYVAYERHDGSLILIKGWGPEGTMIPPHFSDAPFEYFGIMELKRAFETRLLHADYLYPGTEMYERIQEEIQQARENASELDDDFPAGHWIFIENSELVFCKDKEELDQVARFEGPIDDDFNRFVTKYYNLDFKSRFISKLSAEENKSKEV